MSLSGTNAVCITMQNSKQLRAKRLSHHNWLANNNNSDKAQLITTGELEMLMRCEFKKNADIGHKEFPHQVTQSTSVRESARDAIIEQLFNLQSKGKITIHDFDSRDVGEFAECVLRHIRLARTEIDARTRTLMTSAPGVKQVRGGEKL